MSNKRVLFLCLFMLAFMQISAQHVSYKTFQKYALEVYDVVCKKPRGFIDLRTSVNWWPGGMNCGVGFMYDPVFRSKSGDCLIMYPTIGLWSTLRPPVREQLAYEIMAPLEAEYIALPILGESLAMDAMNTIEAPLFIFFCFSNLV